MESLAQLTDTCRYLPCQSVGTPGWGPCSPCLFLLLSAGAQGDAIRGPVWPSLDVSSLYLFWDHLWLFSWNFTFHSFMHKGLLCWTIMLWTSTHFSHHLSVQLIFPEVQVLTQDLTLHQPLFLVCCSFIYTCWLPTSSAYKDKQSFLVQGKKDLKWKRTDFPIPSINCLTSSFQFLNHIPWESCLPSFTPQSLCPWFFADFWPPGAFEALSSMSFSQRAAPIQAASAKHDLKVSTMCRTIWFLGSFSLCSCPAFSDWATDQLVFRHSILTSLIWPKDSFPSGLFKKFFLNITFFIVVVNLHPRIFLPLIF